MKVEIPVLDPFKLDLEDLNSEAMQFLAELREVLLVFNQFEEWMYITFRRNATKAEYLKNGSSAWVYKDHPRRGWWIMDIQIDLDILRATNLERYTRRLQLFSADFVGEASTVIKAFKVVFEYLEQKKKDISPTLPEKLKKALEALR